METDSTNSAIAARDEIRALRDRMVAALNARDLDAILRQVAPEVIFTPLNNEVRHGWEA